jgi:hypothetical protein
MARVVLVIFRKGTSKFRHDLSQAVFEHAQRLARQHNLLTIELRLELQRVRFKILILTSLTCEPGKTSRTKGTSHAFGLSSTGWRVLSTLQAAEGEGVGRK